MIPFHFTVLAIVFIFSHIFLCSEIVFAANIFESEPSRLVHAHLCKEDDGLRYQLPFSVNAKCIDGSRPVFYHRKGSGKGSKNWLIYFEGGGWCFDEESCFQRSSTILGSSNTYPKCLSKDSMKDHLSATAQKNPLFYNWNTVHVRYCDGTSYAGDTEISYKGKKLYLRGKANRDETIRYLLTLGMSKAQEIVISGCSAGALALFLGIDEMKRIILERNPNAIVRGLAFSGFFLEHTSGETYPEKWINRDDGMINGKLDYANAMRHLFYKANMSSGIHPECIYQHSKHSLPGTITQSMITKYQNVSQETSRIYSDPSDCIFSAIVGKYITSPMFLMQPQYDYWQILHIVSKNFTNGQVNSYGQVLSNQLLESFKFIDPTLLTTSSSSDNIMKIHKKSFHGVYLESCTHHGFSCSTHDEDTWIGSHLLAPLIQKQDGMKYTPAAAFQLWYDHSMVNMTNAKSPSTSSNSNSKAPQTMFFLQNATFPCKHCCKCTISSSLN